MISSGILFGCFLAIVFGVKVLGTYLFADSCEGDGNFRSPMDYYDHEPEDEPNEELDDSSQNDLKTIKIIKFEIDKLKKQLKKEG